MNCPKCHKSDEVVTRADGRYCLDCGERVEPAPLDAAACSLIVDVARFMAYANARGRFNAVAESAEKEAIIKSDGDANAHRWQASAKALLSMNGHLSSENV